MPMDSFSRYCNSFLRDSKKGEIVFFEDHDRSYSYKDLIETAFFLAEELLETPSPYIALKMKSPYALFCYLIAGVFAEKKTLILSNLEPDESIIRLKETIDFTKVLTDFDYINYSKKKLTKGFNDADMEAPRFFILSSGSTGIPKAIGLSLKNIFSSCDSLIDILGLDQNDSALVNLPHHHIGGLMIFWRAFFTMGKTTVNSHYTLLSLVPLQLSRSLADSNQLLKLKECKAVFIGGGILESDLKKRAESLGIKIYETYGMTETTSMVMLNGTPLKNQEIKLDEAGHFLIKGPTLAPDLPLNDEGFYKTQDIGSISSIGKFTFTHRADLLFKSAGEMINPQLIEAFTKMLPNIKEAVVVPVKHPVWTHATALVFERMDSSKELELEIEEIKTHLKKSLHPYQVPKFFYEKEKTDLKYAIKPNRFILKQWAQHRYSSSLFHHSYHQSPKASRLVVVFHGFMEDHTDFETLVIDLKLNTKTSFLLIDLPGHGQTKISNFTTREQVFSELQNFIEIFPEAQKNYYGYSMGGRIALELALNHAPPSKLILESSSLGLSNEDEIKQKILIDDALFNDSYDSKVFFNNWYKNPIFYNYNQSPSYSSDCEKKSFHNFKEWQSSLLYFSAGRSPFLLQENIEKIKLSTFKMDLIYGELDLKYKDHFQKTKADIALGLHEIKDAGHNPHKTKLFEVREILEGILNS
jgi:2-succinyl-6-hydroxy-2,4-cyclohexadiene-1-carboxylate synthase